MDTTETGLASWYTCETQGPRTASGEVCDPTGLTAAHPNLPFGTMVRVTNRDNGSTVEVRINDRGPFVDGRIIDLIEGAARQIDMIDTGVVPVQVDVIDTVQPPSRS
ncbi:septal ring lytic transglycosylase RlpA family protein [Nocardia alni]|uniref:septal ring lytic transglycosylase RlpA family protein n=1 Tax=Nocardia alni TaxID=2815723 RepID=UPI001C21EEEE|nr:septal ring lytic transglycosylase RlpA family protein [Nocardia alni]